MQDHGGRGDSTDAWFGGVWATRLTCPRCLQDVAIVGDGLSCLFYGFPFRIDGVGPAAEDPISWVLILGTRVPSSRSELMCC